MTEPMSTSDRRAELAANFEDLEARVSRACTASGRARSEVSVIAVTKTFPVSDVRLLASLGVTDVGENRDQEAAPKQADCTDLSLRWHFVGGLQRNKCRSVARYAAVVHSLDRAGLVTALSAAAVAAGRTIEALVQVSLASPESQDVGRHGAPPAEVSGLAEQIAAAPGLSLGGLMAVAPLGVDADVALAALPDLAAAVRAVEAGATIVSAGMSGDLEAAVRHGATHLRVGTALLGRRSPQVR